MLHIRKGQLIKNQFRGYYPPDKDELDKLWQEGLVVLDTNALLNLFRYTPDTRDQFFGVLELVQDRLWIPHQVGQEFQRRRLEVIDQQMTAFDEIDANLTSAKSSIAKALQKFRRHPSLDVESITNNVDEYIDSVSKTIGESRDEHSKTAVDERGNEKTFEQVTKLYEGRVGDPYLKGRLSEIFDEGATRFSAKVPPGYKDVDKPEPERYGDLVLWKQILDKAAEASTPTIFVTDDAKEDWWYKVNGRTQGPRVELIHEYFEASKSRIHFYSPERFLAFAIERSNSPIRTDFLGEVEDVSNQRNTARAADQLAIRRKELLQTRDRLLTQLQNGRQPGSQDSFFERRAQERQQQIESLNHQLMMTVSEANEIIQLLESDDISGESRDQSLMALGRLQTTQRSLQANIEESVAERERFVRMVNRRQPRVLIEQTQGRLADLEQQLHEVSLAIEELEA